MYIHHDLLLITFIPGLILHLYITILSPILHVTLHPIFQLIAILWLSLPQYQGAACVYDRIINPWVDIYENQVDEQIDQAHRGVRRWIWKRLGGVIWIVIGEGGSIFEGLMNILVGQMGGNNKKSEDDANTDIQQSNSSETLPPRHSIKEAMSDELDRVSSDSSEFVTEFLGMLEQGLYVFAHASPTTCDEYSDVKGSFKLSIFSYDEGGFLIAPTDANNSDTNETAPIRLSLDSLTSLQSSGSQGLIMEDNEIRAEIVLSDESDRDILMDGLRACLPKM